MALNDGVQLKREESVGNDIVLTDINPKTNTKSIDDSMSGDTLDKTIDRLWQSINNKLSRVVNSVNGRTGVVVLTAEDVGLDQVDNVSFGDIKKWIINRLEQEFNNKRIGLFDTLNDVRTYISDNDKSHADKPFYSHHGFEGDNRAYIGYIWWDEGKQSLNETHMVIDTIGSTDNSIIYSEELNDKNYSGGKLGVNIWKYEDALELYNSLSGGKADSGLRINKDKIVPNIYQFDGVYGNGEVDDKDALLWYTAGIPSDAPYLKIFIDGTSVKNNLNSSNPTDGTFYIRLENKNEDKFKIGDIIICNFKNYCVDHKIPSGMNYDLMNRNPAIGMVTDVPNEDDSISYYVIEFYTIGVYPGWGLINNVTEPRDPSTCGTYRNTHPYMSLDILLTKGMIAQEPTASHNMSGMTLIKKNEDPGNPVGVTTGTIMLPSGPTNVMSEYGKYNGGLRVNTDASLCIIPYTLCGREWLTDQSDSCLACNWRANVEHNISDNNTGKPYVKGSEYDGSNASGIGINLLKATNPGILVNEDAYTGLGVYNYKFTNLSGLRISNSEQKMTKSFLGLSENDIYGDTDISTGPIDQSSTSGGLSVNVGKYLEIKPGDIKESYMDYYDGGKVNVRINEDKGLIGNINNQIELNTNDLFFDYDKTDKTLCVRIDYNKGMGVWRKKDTDPDEIEFDGVFVKINEDKGLEFNNTGKISIKIDDTKGLLFDDTGKIGVKTGKGIEFDENGNLIAKGGDNPLTFVDNSGTTVEYKPSSETATTITLGRGLKITED